MFHEVLQTSDRRLATADLCGKYVERRSARCTGEWKVSWIKKYSGASNCANLVYESTSLSRVSVVFGPMRDAETLLSITLDLLKDPVARMGIWRCPTPQRTACLFLGKKCHFDGRRALGKHLSHSFPLFLIVGGGGGMQTTFPAEHRRSFHLHTYNYVGSLRCPIIDA